MRPQEFRDKTIVIPASESRAYLAHADIEYDVLKKGALAGFMAERNTSIYAPPASPGWSGYMSCVAEIRKGHAQTGTWKMLDLQNRALTQHRSRALRFGATKGNSATGIVQGKPNVVNPKGIATVEGVDEYSLRIDVPAYGFDPSVAPPDGEWIFLYAGDSGGQTLRSEFSLPVSFDANGYVTAWRVRVIIEEIILGGYIQNDIFTVQNDEVGFEIRKSRGA